MFDSISNGGCCKGSTIVVSTGQIVFSGDGAGLSNLNASNLSSGTLLSARLPVTGVTPGVYGDAGTVAQVTLDQYGRVTSASNIAIPGISTFDSITSNSVQTSNIFGRTATLSGITGLTTLTVTGNIICTNLTVTGGIVTGRSTSYGALSTDVYIGVNGAGVTVTLPLGSTLPAGKTFIIKDEGGTAGTSAITISTTSPNLCDGSASVTINRNYMALQILWTGTVWSII